MYKLNMTYKKDDTLYPREDSNKPMAIILKVDELRQYWYLIEYINTSGQIKTEWLTLAEIRAYYFSKAEAVLFARTRK